MGVFNRKSILIFITLLISSSRLLAQNDTLILNNNDIIVGEIKSFQKGILIISTDYSDSDFNIEWLKVREIYSNRLYLFILSSGHLYTGYFKHDPDEPSSILIDESGQIQRTTLSEIIFLKAVEGNFFGRFKLSLDVGFLITKADNLRQYTVESRMSYTGDSWMANAHFDAVRSRQDSVADTRRTEASIGGRYMFENNWFIPLSANFLQNDEQKLDLRSTIQTGFGRFFVNSERIYLAGAGGLAWNNEHFTDDQPQRNSMEALAGFELNLFNIKDFSLLTNMYIFPSITEKGRIRVDAKIDLKYDLLLDFYIKIGYTHNYDNQPAKDAQMHDYIFQTTIGWELK